MTKLTYESDGIKVLQNNDEFTLIDTNREHPNHKLHWRYGLRCWSQQVAQKNFNNVKGTGAIIRLTSAELTAQFKPKENAQYSGTNRENA